MNRLFTGVAAPAILAAAIVAGCGSSSSSNSSSASAPAGSSSQSSGGASSSQSSGGASSSPGSSGTAKTVKITTKHDKFGTVLAAGSKQLTVYLFEADKSAKSNCMSACASAWPPVIGKPKATNQAQAADLSTIKRPNGQLQVVYKGHPLYYFVKDKDAEDAYGQGIDNFGAEWYVLAPSGNKVDEHEGS
jgi:predicted lipoprotein with Yx(FWY)xxD motif